ncbi:hypothetical protein CHS0354_033972 [Potamilus streckersoni]|uniref:Uncharacterized protein n=1 Tax=Potamilus streckersoni TaxID=2493646 RepID=A0AAE0T9I8_9BIVA|nr:hypothetical protein CHS0354_033972 [Potamilus streckersoni]
MTVKLFLCVTLGLSAQCLVESCDEKTRTEIRTLLDPLYSNVAYHNLTEMYSAICSDKMQQDLVKGILKLEPCLEDYLDDYGLTWASLFVPYTRRILKKLSQQYIKDVCQTFQNLLPHTKCIDNLLESWYDRPELLQPMFTCLLTRPSEEPCSIVNVVVDVTASCILDLVKMDCPNAWDATAAFLDADRKIMPRDCKCASPGEKCGE